MINEENAKRYCYEDISKIENYYDAVNDTTQMWDCHHRNEIIMNCGHNELKAVGAYYDRPAHELIFLTKNEHTKLHKTGNKYFFGKHHTEEAKRKNRESQLGEKSAWFGRHHTEETKRKIGMGNKGKIVSEEARRKNAEAHRGKHTSKDTKIKLSSSMIGLIFWNDGKKNIRARECPSGFVKGRLSHKLK